MEPSADFVHRRRRRRRVLTLSTFRRKQKTEGWPPGCLAVLGLEGSLGNAYLGSHTHAQFRPHQY